MSLTPEQLEDFVLKLADDTARWQPYVSHDSSRRTYKLIWEDEEVNAWLLCWSQDQDTGFHDHDVSSAAITVIGGEVREDRLRLGGPARETVYREGQTFTVPPSAIHRVLHAGSGLATTIHAYSPPLLRTGAYALGDDGELLRISQEGEEELRDEMAFTGV